eukprot:UN07035
MADRQDNSEEKQEIEYSPEDLQIIDDLVSQFLRAPGQVDIPDEDGDETETSDDANLDEDFDSGEQLNEVESEGPPKVDMDKFQILKVWMILA